MKKDRGIKKLPDGRLEIRVRGVDPRTGKRKEVRRVVEWRGIRKARELQRQWREELENPTIADAQRLTLSDYAKRWLKSKKLEGYRPMTLDNRVQVLENHILPSLGHIYVDAIRGQDIKDWLAFSATKLQPAPKSDPDREERYGSRTINGWLRILKLVLRDAVAELELDRDPTLRIHALKEPPGKDKALSAGELCSFLDAAVTLLAKKKITFANLTLLQLGFFTGMRWSELSALHWDDLDTEQECIRIVRGQVRKHVGTPKTGKSRTVPVAPGVLKALEEHRRMMVRDQAPGVETGIMFPSRTGDYRLPSSITKTILNIRKEAKIDRPISPHWMRHTFNNLMRQARVDRVVLQATTGHSTDAMTEHYSHVGLVEKKEATARLLSLVEMGRESRSG